MIQSAEPLNLIVARDFTMVKGGIIANRTNGSEAAVSEQVGNENDWLLFNRSATATGKRPAPVEAYSELVNFEKHGFMYLVLIYVLFDLGQHRP